MVTVGRIVRPHGNRGRRSWCARRRISRSERFKAGATLRGSAAGADGRSTVTRGAGSIDGRWVVGFEGVGTIDEAEALRGLELRIPADACGRSARRVLRARPGRLRRADGRRAVVVGVVEQREARRRHAAAGRRSEAGRSAGAAGRGRSAGDVDLAGEAIVIDPPEGLIELNRTGATADGDRRHHDLPGDGRGGAGGRRRRRGRESAGLVDIRVRDLREFTDDRHRTVDDVPYRRRAGDGDEARAARSGRSRRWQPSAGRRRRWC